MGTIIPSVLCVKVRSYNALLASQLEELERLCAQVQQSRGSSPRGPKGKPFDVSRLPPGFFSGDPQIVTRGPQGFKGNNRGSG